MANALSKVFTPKDHITAEAINAALRPIYAELVAVREKRADYEAQITLFNSEGIKRVAEAIKPLVDQLESAIDGGLLVAQTADLVELVGGDEASFLIPESARVAFRPTPFLAILAPNEREDWAIGRTVLYNDATGLITVEILYLHGSGAARTGWTLSASSGVVEAVSEWFDEISTKRDEVIAARDLVIQALADVNLAVILIAGGPVSSINGTLTGAVTGVAMSVDHYTKSAMDITVASLVEAIDLKASSSSVTAALSDKADKTTTYTKTEVDAAVATKTTDDAVLEQIHSMSLVI